MKLRCSPATRSGARSETVKVLKVGEEAAGIWSLGNMLEEDSASCSAERNSMSFEMEEEISISGRFWGAKAMGVSTSTRI